VRDERRDEQIAHRQQRAHDVLGAHHLRARVGAEGREDVVLRRVGEPVEQQVDAQQQQPERARPVRVALARPLRRARVV